MCNKGVISLSEQGIPKSAVEGDNNLFSSMLCTSAPYFLFLFPFQFCCCVRWGALKTPSHCA